MSTVSGTTATETMQAMVLHDIMDYRVEEVPRPQLDAGGLLLRVHACGLCGSDLRTIRSGHKHVHLPWTLGHEICGEVAELSPGYEGPWQVGDRLSVGPIVYDPFDPFCQEGRHELSGNIRELGQAWPGGMAEYVALPEGSIKLGNVLPSPEHLKSEHAAIVEPASSVIHAHERAKTTIGDTVLVMGAGPIGCLHIAVARACGADKIILSDLVNQRLELAEAFEPDATINPKEQDLRQTVLEMTDGKGPSIVITANPAPQAQVEAVEFTAKGGRVVLFGGLPHDNSKPGVDMNLVHYKNLDLIGISVFAPRHFRRSLQMLASGRIPADKLVTHVYSLSNLAKGVEAAMDGQALKVVFKP